MIEHMDGMQEVGAMYWVFSLVQPLSLRSAFPLCSCASRKLLELILLSMVCLLLLLAFDGLVEIGHCKGYHATAFLLSL